MIKQILRSNPQHYVISSHTVLKELEMELFMRIIQRVARFVREDLYDLKDQPVLMVQENVRLVITAQHQDILEFHDLLEHIVQKEVISFQSHAQRELSIIILGNRIVPNVLLGIYVPLKVYSTQFYECQAWFAIKKVFHSHTFYVLRDWYAQEKSNPQLR